MLSQANNTNSNISFLSKNSGQNSVFRKLVPLSVLSTNFNPLVKNSDSPPIRVLVHNHIHLKAYRIDCNHSKRSIVQERLLGVEEKLYKVLSSWCKRSCTHLAKGVLSSGVRCWFWVYPNQEKENLKRIVWGLDVGHEDRTRIKSFVFAFAFF